MFVRLAVPLVFLVACSKTPAPPTPPVDAAEPAKSGATPYTASPSHIRLGPTDEPGQPMHLTGVLSRAEDGSPLPGRPFHIYQADLDGEYDARVPEDDSTARLSSAIVTDAAGRFGIRTVLPGVYGTPPGDPHIHVDVSDARPPGYDIYFDKFMGESTRRWAAGNQQVHIVALSTRADGTLVGHVELAVRGVARP